MLLAMLLPKFLAKKLLTHKRSFVVVESNKEIIDKHQNEDILFVLGNANEDEVLQLARCFCQAFLIG